uniref:CHHC U11-48K-type domain-containing protein n=1 Tax=Quercus lobata TaxID=97700 RepID=A0A7N2R7U6_QUELO
MNPNSLLTTLENLIHFSQQTLRHSLSLSISTTLHSENQNLIQCPFNPHHLIPSSALFRHSLRCHCSSSSSSSNFFYNDCPAVVHFSTLHTATPTATATPLPPFLSLHSPNNPSPFDFDFSILPSDLLSIRAETDAWTDYPTAYSHAILRSLSLSLSGLIGNWVIMSSLRYGSIVIDVAMRDHILLLFRLCLNTIVTEALHNYSQQQQQKSNEQSVMSIFKCPVLVQALMWLASQLSILYGEMNGKLFAIHMLKQCVLEAAQLGLFITTQTQTQSHAGRGDEVISVSQVQAAVTALKERAVLQQNFNGFHVSQPLTKYQLPVFGPYGIGLWKNISRGWPFSRYILYDIGDGSGVKFWQDCWCGETPLAVCFPELFRFCRDKEASVAELMKFTNGVYFWVIWKQKIPSRVAFFVWIAALGKCLTIDHLQKRVAEHDYLSQRAYEERKRRPNYRPILEHDGLRQQSFRQETNKTKTREELLAEERDYKRRRMSYRGKKGKKTTVQVTRDIIDEYMEEIKKAGGIGCLVKGTEDQGMFPSESFSAHDSTITVDEPRKSDYAAPRGSQYNYRAHSNSDYGKRSNSLKDASLNEHHECVNQRFSNRNKRDREIYSRSPSRNDSTITVDEPRKSDYAAARGSQYNDRTQSHSDRGKRSKSLKDVSLNEHHEYVNQRCSNRDKHGSEIYSRSPSRNDSHRRSHVRSSHRRERDDLEVSNTRHHEIKQPSSGMLKYHYSRSSSSRSNSVNDSVAKEDEQKSNVEDRRGRKTYENHSSDFLVQNAFEDRYIPSESRDMYEDDLSTGSKHQTR